MFVMHVYGSVHVCMHRYTEIFTCILIKVNINHTTHLDKKWFDMQQCIMLHDVVQLLAMHKYLYWFANNYNMI